MQHIPRTNTIIVAKCHDTKDDDGDGDLVRIRFILAVVVVFVDSSGGGIFSLTTSSFISKDFDFSLLHRFPEEIDEVQAQRQPTCY